jgi:hypothetical protein
LCYDALIPNGKATEVKFGAATRQFMELPVFQDNLRSSGGWAAALDAARERWQRAQAEPDSRGEMLAEVEEWQLKHAERRAEMSAGKPLVYVTRCSGQRRWPAFVRAKVLITGWAAETDAALTVPRLLELNRRLADVAADAEVLRKAEAAPLNPAHEPPPAAALPRLLENALEWFAMPSVAEMNPVEQAALVYLRLLDLQPFAAANEPTALLAASFYVERAGLPPLIIKSNRRHDAALEAAFRMLTQPLVEFFADCLIQTINRAVAKEGR